MKPIGSVVSIYYDGWSVVDEGDVIQTPTGRSYRCLRNRIQQKGIHKGRQHLTCLVIDPDSVVDDVVHALHWYAR